MFIFQLVHWNVSFLKAGTGGLTSSVTQTSARHRAVPQSYLLSDTPSECTGTVLNALHLFLQVVPTPALMEAMELAVSICQMKKLRLAHSHAASKWQSWDSDSVLPELFCSTAQAWREAWGCSRQQAP